MSNLNAPASHHPEGPSQWPAWSICPRYEGEKDIEDADVEALTPREEREKNASDKSPKGRGTLQHEALAKALRGLPNPFEGLSHTEEEQVRWVAEQTVQRAAGVGYAADEIRVEQRLTMFKPDSFEILYFGTGDIEFGPFLKDAKFGDPRNYFAQMCGYALAKMERDDLDRVYVELLYGRWKKVVGYVIDRETAELVAYSILRRRADPNSEPVLCEFCGWCAKRTTCTAMTGAVNTLLSKRLDWAVRLPSMSTREVGVNPVMVGAMKWIWKAFIEDWGAGVDYAASAMAEGGIVPIGFIKQNQVGKLTIDDGKAVIDALIAAGVDVEHILASLSHSQGTLAAAYMAQFGVSEATAKKKVEAILTAAKVARRGDATFKLIRKGDAEDEIRAALARPALGAGQ